MRHDEPQVLRLPSAEPAGHVTLYMRAFDAASRGDRGAELLALDALARLDILVAFGRSHRVRVPESLTRKPRRVKRCVQDATCDPSMPTKEESGPGATPDRLRSLGSEAFVEPRPARGTTLDKRGSRQ